MDPEMIKTKRYEVFEGTGTIFYAILWPPAIEIFDDIEEWVADELNVIESKNYRFRSGFENFVHDVYATDHRNEEWFYKAKRHTILQNEPIIRVLKLEVPNPSFRTSKGGLLANDTYDTKMKIRKKIQKISDDYTYSTFLHMSDNFENNIHISNMLASVYDGGYHRIIKNVEANNV
ncbi:hypothetical protein [Methanonatronarchaeum sp. AMET6-2]|uniref:hypothetical protein n=1 Tax=Methanonatronarchaeum sp. AMET6-2 TaxID=2933293 RepID=UPI001FF2DCA6|nr:hypothetical protein [Methanonatronarchaeum sp. AMET6-2]UOY10282.1 hypothetical protein MU439_01225 [Methanonatronarchaeum sp. AMET6-2]